MKKILIILTLLFFVAPQYTNTFAMTQAQYYEKTILNEVKRNEKIVLSGEELKNAIGNTRGELMIIRSEVIAKGYKVSHECYPNSVIKRVTIYTADTNINRYYDIHGLWIGDIEYYKDNTLADAYLESQTYSHPTKTASYKASNKFGGGSVSYVGDRISRIGDMSVSYVGDKISRIGDMSVSYVGNRISRIGDMSVSYVGDKISRIGDMSVSYVGDRISRIGDMSVSNVGGNISRIGN